MGGRFFALTALIAAATCSLTATAQPQPDAARRTAARALAEEADQLWDAGNFRGALDRFLRANTLVEAPTFVFRQAECLEKLGRLVEAADRFASVARTTVGPDTPDAFREVIAEAAQRLEGVQSRLPRLEIAVTGTYARTARLLMDGREVPRALWDMPFPVDPGTHTLELTRPQFSTTRTVTLKERETQRIELAFDLKTVAPVAEDSAARSNGPAPPSATPSASSPHDRADSDAGSSTKRLLGWASLGVGGVGLGVGAVAGVVVLKRKSDSSDSCTDTTCPPSKSGFVDDYNRMRTVSTLGFAVGMLATGAGVYLLLTAPTSDVPTQSAQSVQPWVGIGSAGLSGRF